MRPQFCPLTGVSVDASRAGSRVDFTSTCCRVTPTRGSLVQSKRYLSHSWPLSLLLGQAYQSFAILSTVFAFFYTAPEPVSLRCIVNSRRSSRSRCRCLGSGGSQCGAGRYVPYLRIGKLYFGRVFEVKGSYTNLAGAKRTISEASNKLLIRVQIEDTIIGNNSKLIAVFNASRDGSIVSGTKCCSLTVTFIEVQTISAIDVDVEEIKCIAGAIRAEDNAALIPTVNCH